MTNTQYLDEVIKKSGKKIGYLADKCNVSRPTFQAKRENRSEFTGTEIQFLCDELGINSLVEKEKIFFANGVTKM